MNGAPIKVEDLPRHVLVNLVSSLTAENERWVARIKLLEARLEAVGAALVLQKPKAVPDGSGPGPT